MTRDVHDQARELIALQHGFSVAENKWLQAHLDECPSCCEFAEAADRVVRSLRSLPIAADSRLVRATQMRVRFHAARLRETRERMWLVGMACLGVGISASLSVPLLWRLFAWMGQQAGVSSAVWQVGFACLWIVPALVAGATLLVRGTHVTNHGKGQCEL